jgi:hypothetical protein
MFRIAAILAIATLTLCGTLSATLPANFRPAHVSRDGWHAHPARDDVTKETKHRVRFILSHSVSLAEGGIEAEKMAAHNIQHNHMELKEPKWDDIGYHFMVGPSGAILEGRDLAAAASCYSGMNYGSVCAAFLGCFDDVGCNPVSEVTEEMLYAMGVGIADRAFALGITELKRHGCPNVEENEKPVCAEVKGFSELGDRFPYAPGSRIMLKDANGIAPIDYVVEIAQQELDDSYRFAQTAPALSE